MARPPKNHCDYFPHDRDMRDHRKIKAIRSKFGITGYAIWVMLLEHLTGSDGNVFEYSDLEFELMAGSFGVSATEIREVVDYCIKLELLFNAGGWVNSDSLDERLLPVYEKRGKAKEIAKKQHRSNGQFTSNNAVNPVQSVTEMPQSKVNKSKQEEIKKNEIEEKTLEWFVKQIDSIYLEQMRMTHKGKDIQQAAKEAYAHLAADPIRLQRSDASDCKRLLNTWLGNQKLIKNGTPKTFSQDKLASLIEAKYGNQGATE